jgi:hypothetical protein
MVASQQVSQACIQYSSSGLRGLGPRCVPLRCQGDALLALIFGEAGVFLSRRKKSPLTPTITRDVSSLDALQVLLRLRHLIATLSIERPPFAAIEDIVTEMNSERA